MLPGHFHLCLFQPEIPQNTGNIGRIAAATGNRLHLIKPFGFGMSDKNLRRPGLDYWPYLDLEIHDSLDYLLEKFEGRLAFFSKFGEKLYTEIPVQTELLIFGRETNGLPKELHERYAKYMYRMPMFHPQVRSLNLANAVSIATYDLLSRKGLFAE
jgi:tRNA (cytidine/uridine-2'-O-)-methyltransferase